MRQFSSAVANMLDIGRVCLPKKLEPAGQNNMKNFQPFSRVTLAHLPNTTWLLLESLRDTRE